MRGELKNKGLYLMRPKISISLFLICFILFFTPFVKFDCGGQKILEVSGISLVVGKEVEIPSLFGQSKNSRIEPEAYAIITFILIILGALINISKSDMVNKLTIAISSLIILFLFLLKVKIDGDIEKEGGGMIGVKYLISYWLVIIFNVLVILINIYNINLSKIKNPLFQILKVVKY